MDVLCSLNDEREGSKKSLSAPRKTFRACACLRNLGGCWLSNLSVGHRSLITRSTFSWPSALLAAASVLHRDAPSLQRWLECARGCSVRGGAATCECRLRTPFRLYECSRSRSECGCCICTSIDHLPRTQKPDLQVQARGLLLLEGGGATASLHCAHCMCVLWGVCAVFLFLCLRGRTRMQREEEQRRRSSCSCKRLCATSVLTFHRQSTEAWPN